MNIQTRTRTRTRTRTAAAAATAAFAAFVAVASPAASGAAPADPERPCFIVQPRWNDAFGGPAPTCPTPAWQREGVVPSPATSPQADETPAAWTTPRPGSADFMP